MNFESYKRLLQCEQDKDITLKVGKSYTLEFDIEDECAADRIFMTGEVEMFYNWKTEPDYALLYRRIDDSLSSVESEKCQYALDMSADNYDYLYKQGTIGKRHIADKIDRFTDRYRAEHIAVSKCE